MTTPDQIRSHDWSRINQEYKVKFKKKAITIGSASGNQDVTIDADGGGSVFLIDSGETSGTVIKDLVITGGSSYYGGGVA